ncbi:hypothetical protein ElyMa_003397100 [Elysia marginata]|uniref:Uncharacterized protein n=1 Tax=Elysia marginata TaxID=1093978 RepID=A0AAV4JMZ1_9GAST|nr:hypothetical protein ElyMa_003397100 [Elysia marginata]
MFIGSLGALYKPNMVGIRRDAPPEISEPVSVPKPIKEEAGSPQRPPVKPPPDFESAPRGLGGPFPAEEPPAPRFSTQGAGSGRQNTDNDNSYSRGLARSAPLAPPARGPQNYNPESYRDAPSKPVPKLNSPSYAVNNPENEVIPFGYGNPQSVNKQPSYNPPKSSGPPAPTSYSSKPNPFVDPRSSQANPYAPNPAPATSPKRPLRGQDVGNRRFTAPRQEYQQPSAYQPKQLSPPQPPQQQPTQSRQPYGPSGPSDPNGNPQFNVPQTLSSKLDNSIPPPPGTNRINTPANPLPGTPAFPAPFGFPESLKVGQNSPFKNLVSFNSPRPFKSRASAAFPDKDDIFEGFPSTNYDNPPARPAFPAPERRPEATAARPTAPAERPTYPVEYRKPDETPDPYAASPRGSGQDFRPRDTRGYQTRPAENPFYSQPRNPNPAYGFPTQGGALYSNPYGYSSAPNGQCFRYTYAAEGYRLSDIAKSYPE